MLGGWETCYVEGNRQYCWSHDINVMHVTYG